MQRPKEEPVQTLLKKTEGDRPADERDRIKFVALHSDEEERRQARQGGATTQC